MVILLCPHGHGGGGAWRLYDLPAGRKRRPADLGKKVGKPRAEKLYKRFEKGGFLTVFVGSILPPPFPFTPVLMAAGIMQYPRKQFFSALSAGRAVRYLVTAYLGRIYGQRVIDFF